MNGLQFGDVDGGIDGRGFQAFMSEKLLDIADVRNKGSRLNIQYSLHLCDIWIQLFIRR